MSNLTWKITIAVAIIICAVTTFMYVYAKNNCFDTYTKPMYANYSLEQLEGELTEEDGCFVTYGEYNKVYDCNYIIAYKKHGNLIRLIRMNSVINIENNVKKIIYGWSSEQRTVYYLQIPEDARAEDFSWIPDLELEYKANISEIEALVEDLDNRELVVSDWISGYYYHRGLLIMTCDSSADKQIVYKLILPMEASPDSNIKHAGPPAIEVGIDEKE